MNYFKNPESGEVFAYDDEQVVAGLADGKTPMTAEEVEAHVNPQPTPEQVKESINAEARAYLASTDYIVTKISEAMALGQDTAPLLAQCAEELKQREQARARIRINEGRA